MGLLSGLFGGQTGPVATNDQIVAQQKQQAAQATAANQQRNARLGYGKNLIQSIFEGIPSGATPLDVSSITQANAPTTPSLQNAFGAAGEPAAMSEWLAKNPWYDTSQLTGAAAADPANRKALAGGYSWGILPDTGAGTTYGIYDPSGQLTNTSSNLSDLAASKIYTGGDPTKKTGGFQPEFYDKYRQSILDYYMPQESDQYNTARSDLAASLARAGTLDSSFATQSIGKLSKQDAINRAQIASGADTQTGTLRTSVAQDEQSALNQLYSTEDPSVAANTAGNMVAAAQLTKPMLNPAGALFAPITAGVGTSLTGFLNPTSYINPNAGGAAATPGGQKDYGQTTQGY
jgi:hypothetical protein